MYIGKVGFYIQLYLRTLNSTFIMARPTLRTEYLIRDDAARIKELFGTISNAYQLLSLTDRVPESEFRRALSYGSIRPEHKDLIEDAWSEWKRMFLRPDTGLITSFQRTVD